MSLVVAHGGVVIVVVIIVCVFKQMMAYEMRISDWSSDVCSSDLRDGVVEIRDFLPAATFSALQEQLFSYRGPAREMVQGDTITRRLAIDRKSTRLNSSH